MLRAPQRVKLELTAKIPITRSWASAGITSPHLPRGSLRRSWQRAGDRRSVVSCRVPFVPYLAWHALKAAGATIQARSPESRYEESDRTEVEASTDHLAQAFCRSAGLDDIVVTSRAEQAQQIRGFPEADGQPTRDGGRKGAEGRLLGISTAAAES